MTVFGSFRLDPANQCLWRDDRRISMAPKLFSVLNYLVENAGTLVSQDDLLQAVWPETFVQPEVLRKYVQELRKILGDSAQNPVYLETIPKRGYRFRAQVAPSPAAVSAKAAASVEPAPSPIPRQPVPPGRANVLQDLGAHLHKAQGGERQLILITGESGIGKSTVVDAFHAVVAPEARVVRGQCVEGFGGKEAYYPFLEALGQLVRGPGAEAVVNILASQAPTWLIQFPALLGPGQREALQRELLGATRERMVREICEAFETMTASVPLVVILEDLHWVDTSTLDLLSALARRRGPAKLLILGTYRPVDVILSRSPLKGLKQDLVIHRLCREVVLERLAESDVGDHLADVVPGGAVPAGLANLIHYHSDGNPLFMAAILADLMERGLVSASSGGWHLGKPLDEIRPGVPDTLQQMLETRFDQLDEMERRVLTSATTAGQRFSAWAVAAMLNREPWTVEEICEKLVERQQFLIAGRAAGVLGCDVSAVYEFRHSLYREALMRRVPQAQRAQMHRALAEKGEQLAGIGAPEFAAEMALHFEYGRDPVRAARYLVITADNASRRYGHRDAFAALTHARELLLSASSEQTHGLEIEILEKISDAQYALGEMEESARTDGAAASLASERGMKHAEVAALTRAARALSFLDPDDCVAVCEMAARACSTMGEPLLEARTAMLAACWRIVSNGWTKADSDICAASSVKIVEMEGSATPAYYDVLYAHVQALQGAYGDSCRIADAGIRRATETHSLVIYLSSLSSKSLALIQQGRWGELRVVLDHAVELAEKNGTNPWIGIFRAMLAWLHMLSWDFEGAREQATHLLRIHTEEPIGQAQSVALMTLGYVELSTGQYASALKTLRRVRDRLPKPKVFLQWYWRMIAEYGIFVTLLESGDLENAAATAEDFLKDALSTADPALRAPAWEGMARVAFARGDGEAAAENMEKAFAEIAGHELPSVAWRVHATAARIRSRAGDKKKAEEHREKAAAALRFAASSFGQGDPLRKSLSAAADQIESPGAKLVESRIATP